MNENKVAVAVNCSVDRDGLTVPLLICWKDGRQFPIERVLHVCMEEDEEGERIQYAVTVCGKQKYLYRCGQRWYVLT